MQATDGSLYAFETLLAPLIGRQLDARFLNSRMLDLARLRSGTYQDSGGTRRIVVATHSLVLQFGHKLAFQGVHLVGV